MPFHETVVRAGIDDVFGCLLFAWVFGFFLFRLVTTKTNRGFVWGKDTKNELGTLTIESPGSSAPLPYKVKILVSELDIPGPRTFAFDMWDQSFASRRGQTLTLRQEQMGELADALEQALSTLESPGASA